MTILGLIAVIIALGGLDVVAGAVLAVMWWRLRPLRAKSKVAK